MIADIMAVFDDMYEKHGERLVIDNYTLAPGTYVLLSLTEGIKQVYEVDKNTPRTDDLYSYFVVRDYYSKLVSMNKPIKDKRIHSNQIYSFFIKKENLQKKKKENVRKKQLTVEEVIGEYFGILQNPRAKYKKEKQKLAMYEEAEFVYGAVNEEEVQQIKQSILFHLPEIQQQMKDDKNYLKIFIERDEEDFIKEGKKYIIPNVFNSTDYNIVLNGETYGLPNDNMGLDSKKPYLDNKQRKIKVPTLMSLEDVLKQKVLFEHLMNFAAQGQRYLFIEQSETPKITAIKNNQTMEEEFTGYFLYIQKGKELEIHEFDTIQSYSPKENFTFINVLDITLTEYDKNIEFKDYEKLEDIQRLVNEIYFKKFLMTNYFTDAKDIKLREAYLKEMLVVSRKAWFNWFYKGNTQLIESMLDKVLLAIIKGTIIHDSIYKARHQYNLYYSLKEHFTRSDVKMADVLSSIKEQLRTKIDQSETASITDDREYYFAVGQVAAYLLSKSKSEKKTDDLLNPIINCANVRTLNQCLINLYKKYNHAVAQGDKKFHNLLAMVQSYEPEGKKVDTNSIIAGYLHSNLMYEKTAKEPQPKATNEGASE